MNKKDKDALKRERCIRAHALAENGYSEAEIAKVLGVSEQIVKKLLKEKKDGE